LENNNAITTKIEEINVLGCANEELEVEESYIELIYET
jgi:hypothetical protein